MTNNTHDSDDYTEQPPSYQHHLLTQTSTRMKRALAAPLIITLGVAMALCGVFSFNQTPPAQAAVVYDPNTCQYVSTGETWATMASNPGPIEILSATVTPSSGSTATFFTYTVQTSKPASELTFNFNGNSTVYNVYSDKRSNFGSSVSVTINGDKTLWTIANDTLNAGSRSITITAYDFCGGSPAQTTKYVTVTGTTPPPPVTTTQPTQNPAPAANSLPFGWLDTVTSPGVGKVRVTGWVIDKDAPTTGVTIHGYVGGETGNPNALSYNLGAATSTRTDVADAYPGTGSNHGFDATFSTSKTGYQEVCVYAINIPAGSNPLLWNGCQYVTIATPVNITISFNGNGASGTAPATKTVQSGSSVTMPNQANMYKSGYSFGGWSTSSSGTGQVYSAGNSYTFSTNTTLYAIWTKLTYTVTFNSNGGASVPPSQQGGYGSVITMPTTTRTGYVLLGWSTSQTATTAMYTPGMSYTIQSTVTMYAVWTVGITITFRGDSLPTNPIFDLTQIQGGTTTVKPGSTVKIPGVQNLVMNKLTMVGWNDKPDGSGQIYLIGQSYQFDRSTTLYPVWKAVITLDANGATAGPPSLTLQVTPGASQVMPSNSIITRSGYIFTGWNTQKDGKGSNYNAGSSYTTSTNVTLYARWMSTASLSDFTANISGTLQVGKTLTANITKGQSFPTSDVTLTYTWLTDTKGCPSASTWSSTLDGIEEIYPGDAVTGTSFTLRPRDYRQLVCLKATATSYGQSVSKIVSTGSNVVLEPELGVMNNNPMYTAFVSTKANPTTNTTKVEQYTASNLQLLEYQITTGWSVSGKVATLTSVSVNNAGSSIPYLWLDSIKIYGNCSITTNGNTTSSNANSEVWNGYTPVSSSGVRLWTSSGTNSVKCTVGSDSYIGAVDIVGENGACHNNYAQGGGECNDDTYSSRVYFYLDTNNPSSGGPTGITLNPKILTVPVGSSQQLTASITPANVLVPVVYWESSDSTVATVTYPQPTSWQIVNITGVKPGTAMITARTENGKTATIQVNVPTTITYDANGGTGTPPPAQTALINAPITIPGQGSLSRSGYTFDGWNTKQDGQGTTYTPGSPRSFSASTTLYAKWTPRPTLTISFNANGGSGTPASQTTNSDIAITLPTQGNMTRPGYTLSGWTISPNGTGSVYSAGLQYKFSASTTLYAKWTALPVLTISFSANGGTGTVPEKRTTTNDIAMTLPTQGNLTRIGYTFSGWNTRNDGAGTDYTAGSSYKFTASTTLFAKWTPLSVAINFSVNGGTGTTPAAKTTTSDIAVTLPTQGNLAKTGFTFAGWNTQADGSGTTYTAGSSYKFTASTWLYAKWTALPVLTISFNVNGGTGTTPGAKTTTNDVTVPLPAQGNLAKIGYTFGGWSTQANGSGTTYAAGSSQKFSASTTLYAKWTALPVLTISFNVNGGTGTTPGAKTTTSDVTVPLPAQGNLAKTGYTFGGWNTKADGSGTTYTAGWSQMFTASTTLYAKWTALPTLTISFNLNGGTGTVPTTKTTTSDVAVPLPAQGNLAKIGYTFVGWNTQSNGSGTTYTAGSSTKFSASTTLYAKWTALPTLTISYNANNGTGTVPASMTTTSDVAITLSAQGTLTRTGYTFAGWSTQASGSGTTYAAGSSQKFSASTTLYAKWTALAALTITYNLNGGTGTAPGRQTTTSDVAVTLPTQGNLVRTGYSFGGWNTQANGSGTTYAAGSSQKFSATTTLYARWTPLPTLTITFNANSGSGTVPPPMATTNDASIILPVQGNLAKTGYSFGGWNTQTDGLGTTYAAGSSQKFSATTTLYAKWTALPTLTISFNANGGTGTPPASMATTNGATTTLPAQGNLARTGYTFAGWNTQANGSGTTYAAGSSQKFSATTTLYAKWTALPTLTISFNLNGGSGITVPATTTTTSDAMVTMPSQGSLTRAGYTFLGWNPNADGSSVTYFAGVSYYFSASKVLYAQWTPLPVLTISYSINGGTGTVPATKTTTSDVAVTLPLQGNLTRTGYTFGGWNTKADGSGTTYAAGSSQKFSATTTLYAIWTLPTLTISFNANGGTGTIPTAKTTTSNTSVPMPDQGSLARTGYTFAGWGVKPDGAGGIYGPGTSLGFSASTTMYAIWKALPAVTISYSANGASGTVPAPQTTTSDVAITLPAPTNLTRTGYSFSGWNTQANGTGTTYAAGYSQKFSASTTLYAQWTAVSTSVTVSFDANGATGAVYGPYTIANGSALILPDQGNLSKDGYTFGGWNTKADGTGTFYGVGGSVTFTTSTVLYAIWRSGLSMFLIWFDANGATSGTGPGATSGTGSPFIVTSNASPTTLPTQGDLVKTGYTFAGWNTKADGTGTTYQTGSSVLFTAPTVLYAIWK